jgi:hypothetical protein
MHPRCHDSARARHHHAEASLRPVSLLQQGGLTCGRRYQPLTLLDEENKIGLAPHQALCRGLALESASALRRKSSGGYEISFALGSTSTV